jgi:hypothetical protein
MDFVVAWQQLVAAELLPADAPKGGNVFLRDNVADRGYLYRPRIKISSTSSCFG